MYLAGQNKLFSKDEINLIVNIIENTCGDSWCEGDYDYEFLDFVCSKNNDSCDLIFQIIHTDNDVEKRTTPQICHFINITNMEQVLENNKSLNVDFYELLDSCISNLDEGKFFK